MALTDMGILALHAPDDLRLAARCVRGDAAAQRELFDRNVHHVHATLYRVLGSNSEIDDLVQETFLEIFRSLEGFRGDATLSTWLDRIAVRVAYGHIGRRRDEGVRLELVADVPSGDTSAEARAMAREAARRLYAILDKLEVHQRVAFTLHVIDGRTLKQVASVMETSVVVTKARIWRATRAVEGRARRDPLLAEFLQCRGAAREEGR